MSATLTSPQRYATTEDDDFIVFARVPVWKEHTNRDGVHFGAAELEKVTKRCNERIEETGDFPTITLRHTGDGRNPKVVGFAGPFEMGTFGKQSDTPAIFATLRIFREDSAEVRRYPRLSVEYWADDDDPTSGYFDPICLLGAETPELDLGIRYQKHTGGRVIRYSRQMHYEAAAPAFPGGSNTFVPSGSDVKKRKSAFDAETYAKANPMATVLSPEDIQAIVAAVESTVDAKIDERLGGLGDEATAAPAGGIPGMEGEEMPPGLEGELPPGAEGELPPGEAENTPGVDMPGDLPKPGEEAAQPEIPGEGAEMPAPEGEAAPGQEAMTAPEAEGLPGPEGEPGKEEEEEEDFKQRYAKVCQYAAEGKDAEAKAACADMTPEQKKKFGEYISANEPDQYKRGKLMAYSADDDGGGADQYARDRKTLAQYIKQHGELQQKYSRLEAAHASTLKRLDTIEAEKRQAVRYQKLGQLEAQGFIFDVEEEYKETEKLTDAEFDRHVSVRIPSRYQRVNIGGSLPADHMSRPTSVKHVKGDGNPSDRYAKRAMEICEAERAAGKDPNFMAAMKTAEEEDKKSASPSVAA